MWWRLQPYVMPSCRGCMATSCTYDSAAPYLAYISRRSLIRQLHISPTSRVDLA